jgi:hypothetical protein
VKSKSLLPLVCLLALGACSASGNLQVVEQKTDLIRNDSTVAIKVDSTPDAGDPDEVELGVSRTKQALHTRLSAEGPFDRVVDANGPSDYTMDVVLNEVDEVGGIVQGLFGAFAGSHSVAADVTVTDNASGLVLTSYNARGDSAPKSIFSIGSGEYTFDSALQAFGDKVVEGLL